MNRAPSSMSRVPLAVMGGAAVLLLGCGAGDNGLDPDALVASCIDVNAVGETVGDRNKLKGSGSFTFGNLERQAQVGVYLFEMKDAENGALFVDTQYQFVWDNGDSFLTADQVFFEPGLTPDEYHFTFPMTITAGGGQFAGLEGQRPISLDAVIRFGPPRNPGDARSAFEEFTAFGAVCGI